LMHDGGPRRGRATASTSPTRGQDNAVPCHPDSLNKFYVSLECFKCRDMS
jgi:hypothetical protein